MCLEARHAWDKYREAPSRQKSALGPPPPPQRQTRVLSARLALRRHRIPAALSAAVSTRVWPAVAAGLSPIALLSRVATRGLRRAAAARECEETCFLSANAPLCLPPAEPPDWRVCVSGLGVWELRPGEKGI